MTNTVVHLFGALDRGGAETRLLEELRARGGREHHVFVSLSGQAGALDAAFGEVGADVVHRALSWRFPLWFFRFLRSRRATHVHSHVQMASGYLLLIAWMAGVPKRIAHFHSVDDGRGRSPSRRAYRVGARLALVIGATDLVFVSDAVRDAVSGGNRALRRRSEVIFQRVDGTRFPPATAAEEHTARIIVVGRMDAEKNPERAVALVAFLVARGHFRHVTLQLVGRAAPKERSEIARRVAKLGIEERVEILSVRDDVPQLLAASDVLLSTSLREGLPGVVLEAAAAGIPAVVSSISPNEEVALWLPSVIPVPLEADDDEWCDVLEDTIEARHTRFDPAIVRAWFAGSPFSLSDESRHLDRLWS